MLQTMAAPSGTEPQATIITKQMRRSNCKCQQTNGSTLSLLQSGKPEEPRTIYVEFELRVSSNIRNINKTKVKHPRYSKVIKQTCLIESERTS